MPRNWNFSDRIQFSGIRKKRKKSLQFIFLLFQFRTSWAWLWASHRSCSRTCRTTTCSRQRYWVSCPSWRRHPTRSRWRPRRGRRSWMGRSSSTTRWKIKSISSSKATFRYSDKSTEKQARQLWLTIPWLLVLPTQVKRTGPGNKWPPKTWQSSFFKVKWEMFCSLLGFKIKSYYVSFAILK